MTLLLKKIPANLKTPLLFGILSMASLLIYRIIFLIAFSYRLEGSTNGEILWAFLVGSRFDLAVTGYIFGPILILASIHYLNKFTIYRSIWIYTAILFFLYMIAILVSDILYFENANKHIGYEAYAFLGKDLLVILKAAFEQNFLSTLGGILMIIAIFTGIQITLNKFPYKHSRRKWKPTLIHFLLSIVLTVIAIRGGLQDTPIRSSNAIISKNTFINTIAINGIFTAMMDLKVSQVSSTHKLKLKSIIPIVQNETKTPNTQFISNKYPLLRKQKQTNHGKPPNIILIMLENWTGHFTKPVSNGLVAGKEVAPHFNKLNKKSVVFKRFFASGGRTTNGMMSILTGIPDRPGLTIVRTQQIMGNFSGLGKIVKQAGYQTLFVTGGDLSFDNKKKVMPHLGFDTVLGKTYMDKTKRYKLGAWGYDDADILDVLHKQIQKLDPTKPFLASALTLTTHYPYRTPHEKFRIFNKTVRDHEYLNVYHYADWSLNEFLKKAKKSKYFKNTIFFFVADHTHHRYLSYYQDRNIPFMIYAPGRVTPAIRNDIASQLDIIPTILGTIGKEFYFSAMGRDLLKRKGSSAYFAYGDVFGWIENKTFYGETIDGFGTGRTALLAPPYTVHTPDPKSRQKYASHYLKARAFLNMSHNLMGNNQIFPSDIELKKIIHQRR